MGLLDERAALAGKVALVAGGAGGLGRMATLDLAGAGVHLALCDRDAEALAATAAQARAVGVEVFSRVLDVRDGEALAAFFADAGEALRRLDILVNVVGGTFRSPFTELGAKGRDTLVRTNFTWVVDAIGHGARAMAAHGNGGSIITLTSIEAHRAAPGYAVYAAMKAAVAHLTRTLAVELGPAGIRVNCVAPDFVPTTGLNALAARAGSGGAVAAADVSGQPGADAGDRLTIPLGRKGRPEDVGGCVLFLASDLSAYITGTTLHPDGGALAGSGWMDWPDDGFTARPPAWVLERLDDGPEGG
ncbi:MAG TPA: SDR family oxidoreductase [Acidimicrobiales bacterium]|nr:SDR family oxidoreductase [Acidimicrobiales bacterium]